VLKGYKRDTLFFGLTPKPTPEVDCGFEKDKLEIPPFEIGLLSIPGHTLGGTSFIIQEHIFHRRCIISRDCWKNRPTRW